MSVTEDGQREGFTGWPTGIKQAAPAIIKFEHASSAEQPRKSWCVRICPDRTCMHEWLPVCAIVVHVCASRGGDIFCLSGHALTMQPLNWGCFRVTPPSGSPWMPHPPGSHIPAVGQGLAVIKRVGQGLASDGLQVPLPVWICGQDLASLPRTVSQDARSLVRRCHRLRCISKR